MITVSQEHLNEHIATKQELARLKSQRFKIVVFSTLFGWLVMPILVAGLPFPRSVKEVVVAINSWYSDLALGLQCTYTKK